MRVLPQGPFGGHLPREDHASNVVGPVRDIIGWRRLFRAVRHIGRK